MKSRERSKGSLDGRKLRQWCYGKHSSLRFGRHVLSSEAGAQQGDPLGRLLFANTIHPVVGRLRSLGKGGTPGLPLDIVMFYLDDGLLCGSAEAVAAALVPSG